MNKESLEPSEVISVAAVSFSKILRDDFDLKEIDLLKEQIQTNQLENDKISKEHQKLVGKSYKEINDLREDNKKLSKQIEDLLQKKVNGFRKGGVI